MHGNSLLTLFVVAPAHARQGAAESFSLEPEIQGNELGASGKSRIEARIASPSESGFSVALKNADDASTADKPVDLPLNFAPCVVEIHRQYIEAALWDDPTAKPCDGD